MQLIFETGASNMFQMQLMIKGIYKSINYQFVKYMLNYDI
jgi:hypothetical protein